MSKLWEIYEDVARKVITDMRNELGISFVEGKQLLDGESSLAWEVDAKAWLEGSDGFLVIEARRHTTSRLAQEAIAAISYRINDVGAAGGIIITPLPLQKGAKALAIHEGISHVRLTADSTNENYLAEFLGRAYIGVSVNESIDPSDSCGASVTETKPVNTSLYPDEV